jgi:hypothetical protein
MWIGVKVRWYNASFFPVGAPEEYRHFIIKIFLGRLPPVIPRTPYPQRRVIALP